MARIMYNKKRLEGKQVGGGGPRDKQLAQRIRKEQELKERILSPSLSAEVPIQQEVDLSQYLPLEEVKKKIEEAVAATAESERKRFESGLKNLNDQLKAERKKAGAFQDQLINANSEISRLKTSVNQSTDISEKAQRVINEKDLSISRLKADNEAKIELYNRLKSELTAHKETIFVKEKEISEYKSKLDVMVEMDTNNKVRIAELETSLKTKDELKTKLDELYDKISDGSIKPLVGSNMDRPSLEDKIFIDPIEANKGTPLDSHIDIKEDKSSKTKSDRDINSDLAKLRNLLKL
jgi:chromosome segregation ATPase